MPGDTSHLVKRLVELIRSHPPGDTGEDVALTIGTLLELHDDHSEEPTDADIEGESPGELADRLMAFVNDYGVEGYDRECVEAAVPYLRALEAHHQ